MSRRHAPKTQSAPEHFWSLETSALEAQIGSGARGLSTDEARVRLERFGRNTLEDHRVLGWLEVLWRQVKSPLVLLLVFAAVASTFAGEWTDAALVFGIVGITSVVGFRREYQAERTVAKLRERVHTRVNVVRDGTTVQRPAEEIVPGDVVLLSAGSLVPGDAVLLEATDLYVSEAALTGEPWPVHKQPGPVANDTPLAKRKGCVWLGTNVRSGSARALVVATGAATSFGAIAGRLVVRAPETEFDRGLRRFGAFLGSAMLVMVLVVFAAHVIGGRSALETLLFSIALAVGLSPELLPAVLGVNLARSAEALAKAGVLVRRLNAIENLGSMDVLCTDKTGTLTEGVVKLDGSFGFDGQPSTQVLELAALNAALETGLDNPLDEAILAAHPFDRASRQKLGERPFDFVRKRVSVVVKDGDGALLVTKGAVHTVLQVCTHVSDGRFIDAELKRQLDARTAAWSEAGTRVIAVASTFAANGTPEEQGLTLQGFITFVDRPKPGAKEAIAALQALGVTVKVITGDNRLVARHVAQQVGLPVGPDAVLSGAELDHMTDEVMWHAAQRAEVFAEVDPRQKERILLALKKAGHVVGFFGDGVNDAPAMHAADTSLSADNAVDVAREAADFVLLEAHLDVIRRGVEEGRRTFANTLKYLLTTMSANLGNMLSMAVASLFLPFLPLTAGQILLNNFLSDVPAIGIAGDAVDPELVARPRRWDMRFMFRFMVQFGLVSSAFDLATFGTLLFVFRAQPETFRTGWFIESLLTELCVALVVRTRRPFWKSRPGRVLLTSTVVLAVLCLVIPYLPGAGWLGFVALPPAVLAAVVGITVTYVLSVEALKRVAMKND